MAKIVIKGNIFCKCCVAALSDKASRPVLSNQIAKAPQIS